MRIFLFLIYISAIAFSNDNSLNLIKQFFNPNGMDNKPKVYTGEMLEFYVNSPTLGKITPKNLKKEIRLLEKNHKEAIYTVSVSNSETSIDWYIYLKKVNGDWKLKSIRKLALSGMFFMLLNELKIKDKRTIEEENTYQNMLLTIKSDQKLKDYLHKNIKELKEIIHLSKSNITLANKKAKSIFFNKVTLLDSNIIDINIGGILDNSVGYLYIPNNVVPPKINDQNYIYLEKIVKDWYIYKTT